ncbi:MAG: HAMP domain-containing protein [Granulosicoccus sp.]
MARSSDSIFLISLFRDKTFQAREIRRVILLSLLYLGITTALVGVFYHQMLGSLLSGMAPLLFVSEDIAMVNEALPTMSTVLGKWMLIMLGVNVLITTVLAVYITRKLGRPILAIKRALRDVGNGELDVRLRASDKHEFGEIANELTVAMHSIREQIAAAKQSMAEVDSLNGQPNSSALNADVDTALSSCRSALDFFNTYSPKTDIDLENDNNSKVA